MGPALAIVGDYNWDGYPKLALLIDISFEKRCKKEG
jgi:hypothetical protein